MDVPIATLYSDPLPYAEQVVCTAGILRVRGADTSMPLVSVTPEGYPAEELFGVDLTPSLYLHELMAAGYEDGDPITLRGRFGLMESCWEAHQGGEGCVPTGAPLWIAGTEILGTTEMTTE